jgi:hypothetical protein
MEDQFNEEEAQWGGGGLDAWAVIGKEAVAICFPCRNSKLLLVLPALPLLHFKPPMRCRYRYGLLATAASGVLDGGTDVVQRDPHHKDTLAQL